MRHDDARMYHAVGYLAANPSAARIFRAITDQIGIIGWGVARASIQRPEETEKILGKLVEINAVIADGRGLDAYYAPSKEAYLYKNMVRNRRGRR